MEITKKNIEIRSRLGFDMNLNLLILGAGQYGMEAMEVTETIFVIPYLKENSYYAQKMSQNRFLHGYKICTGHF